ncbi:MAG TPA: hypothetical protein VF268_07470 [Gammaproteobacteria bacterium]
MNELLTLNYPYIAFSGLIATVVMTTLMQGSLELGFSRLSMPLLVGTIFSGHRSLAVILGFTLYFLGGVLFAFIYLFLFSAIGTTHWLAGLAIGAFHGLFFLVVVLPVLPYLHPRMATEYDGPSVLRRLEPPGFMGLNYGYRTPLTTIVGHTSYGLIMSLFIPLIP